MRLLVGTAAACGSALLATLCPTAAHAAGKACGVTDLTCVEIRDDASLSGGAGAGFFQNYPKPYCNDSEFPTTVSYSMKYFLMNNGKQWPQGPDGALWPGLEDVSLMNFKLDPGEIHMYERWHTHCEGKNKAGDAIMDKAIEFWMPLVSVDAITYQFDLVAEVVRQLGPPVVEFVDADIDHGWLYVNVDHHVAVQPPGRASAEAKVSNPSGTATARVEGVPRELKLELPTETGVEGLAECDLKTATTTGCPIKFSHSSSIADDGWFRGTATLTWIVRSNSGKYNGLGPFTTQSEFQIQVAEAMAVSR